jgi:DNA-binding response OmpR family regulator/HPt (histidine-containing phosphotransfer) domain-containing protein
MKILLIEDHQCTTSTLSKLLVDHNYVVDATNDGETGLRLAKAYDYNLILLDVLLPGLDGISICRQLRSEGYEVPILMLTALDSSTDRVMGLDAGADDYVIKPFDFLELIARVRALLRRGRTILAEELTWENLKLDLKIREVTYNEKRLHLTPREYGLLELLLRNPQRIFSRSAILDLVWPEGEFPGEEAVTTQIKGLRRKLKAAGMTKDLIETVYGLGYRLKEEREKTENEDIGKLTIENSKLKIQKFDPFPITPSPLPYGKPLARLHPITPPSQSRIEAETEVMAVVAKMREEFKNSLSEQIELFERAIALLANGTLDNTLRQKATAEAHRLIGSLGSLGLPEGSKVARQIEQLLQNQTDADRSVALQIKELVDLLWQVVVKGQGKDGEMGRNEQFKIQNYSPTPPLSHSPRRAMARLYISSHSPIPPLPHSSPRLLVIDDDTVLTERLKIEGVAWGLQVEEVTNLTAARKVIADNPPDLILLDLTFPSTTENGLTLLAELTKQKPEIPVVVFTAQSQLSLRLEVARLGADTFLHKPMLADRILQTVIKVLNQTRAVKAKVMVVDDEPEILNVLSVLLSYWGLQVTTLENSQRFWETLEAFAPNLLILDVNMPHFSGLDLCQVVRNDSRWGGIPILFLSAHTDIETVSRVFAMGADDYVSKPIVKTELVSRVLNRLQRVQK